MKNWKQIATGISVLLLGALSAVFGASSVPTQDNQSNLLGSGFYNRQSDSSSTSTGGGDAYLGNNQTFTGRNTFSATTTMATTTISSLTVGSCSGCGTPSAMILHSVTATYDFAVDGGVVGTTTLSGAPTIPDNVVVWLESYDVITTLDSGASLATVKLSLPDEVDGYFFNPITVGVGTSVSEGPYSVVTSRPGVLAANAGNVFKTTGARVPVLVIGGENVTQGKVIFQLNYWQSE